METSKKSEKRYQSEKPYQEKIRRLAINRDARKILTNVILAKAIIETGRSLISLMSHARDTDWNSLMSLAVQMDGLEGGLEQISALKENLKKASPKRRINPEIAVDLMEACSEVWEAIEDEDIDFSGYFEESSSYEDIVGYVLGEKKDPDDFLKGLEDLKKLKGFKETFGKTE